MTGSDSGATARAMVAGAAGALPGVHGSVHRAGVVDGAGAAVVVGAGAVDGDGSGAAVGFGTGPDASGAGEAEPAAGDGLAAGGSAPGSRRSAQAVPCSLAAIWRPVARPAGSAEGTWPSTGQRSAARGAKPTSTGPAGLEHDLVGRVGHRLLVRDRWRLADRLARSGHVVGGGLRPRGWGLTQGGVPHRRARRGDRLDRRDGNRRRHREQAGDQGRDEHGEDERSKGGGEAGSRHVEPLGCAHAARDSGAWDAGGSVR